MAEGKPAVERVVPPKGPFVVINALMKAALGSPLGARMGPGLALLSFTGRRSGKGYRTPVGVHELDGGLLSLTSSGWRHNFSEPAPVTLRRAGRDQALTATLQADPDTVAAVYRTLIERFGHEKAGRRLGIRINVDRVPTHEELADASRRSGLSVVRYSERA